MDMSRFYDMPDGGKTDCICNGACEAMAAGSSVPDGDRDSTECSGKHRRSRSAVPEGSRGLASRRDRVTKRNRILTARYYYWTELRRRRFDDVLRILADDEFFVEERTVSNALIEQDAFYNTLIDDRTTKRQLRRMFPGFDWA